MITKISIKEIPKKKKGEEEEEEERGGRSDDRGSNLHSYLAKEQTEEYLVVASHYFGGSPSSCISLKPSSFLLFLSNSLFPTLA